MNEEYYNYCLKNECFTNTEFSDYLYFRKIPDYIKNGKIRNGLIKIHKKYIKYVKSENFSFFEEFKKFKISTSDKLIKFNDSLLKLTINKDELKFLLDVKIFLVICKKRMVWLKKNFDSIFNDFNDFLIGNKLAKKKLKPIDWGFFKSVDFSGAYGMTSLFSNKTYWGLFLICSLLGLGAFSFVLSLLQNWRKKFISIANDFVSITDNGAVKTGEVKLLQEGTIELVLIHELAHYYSISILETLYQTVKGGLKRFKGKAIDINSEQEGLAEAFAISFAKAKGIDYTEYWDCSTFDYKSYFFERVLKYDSITAMKKVFNYDDYRAYSKEVVIYLENLKVDSEYFSERVSKGGILNGFKLIKSGKMKDEDTLRVLFEIKDLFLRFNQFFRSLSYYLSENSYILKRFLCALGVTRNKDFKNCVDELLGLTENQYSFLKNKDHNTFLSEDNQITFLSNLNNLVRKVNELEKKKLNIDADVINIVLNALKNIKLLLKG
ncbi:MAG: hypothetical protein WC307_00450 [Candidatus Nanoarchaeia archaeon]|jgi:hypothetical protein